MATIAGDKRAMGHGPLGAIALTLGLGDSDLVASDFESFRRQELFFALLNLFLIGALLALQAFSRFVRGRARSCRRLGSGGWLGGASGSPCVVKLEDRAAVAPQAESLHVLVARVQLNARVCAYLHHHQG